MIKLMILALLMPAAVTAEHRFLDRTNVGLFSSAAVVRGLDYHSTQRFRSFGRDEAFLTNRFVDNKPEFAAFSALHVVGNVMVARYFHRRGRHRMERIVSIVHVVAMGAVVVGNYRARRM